MKDEHKKIKKQSYVSFFLSYCTYFYDIWLIHLLIDEIIVGDNHRVFVRLSKLYKVLFMRKAVVMGSD